MDLTQRIRRKAAQLGFDPIGFAPADPLEGAQFYARWVALGYAGQMHYLERNQDKRADPRLMVPGAQSVVCLGMDYYSAKIDTGSKTEADPKTTSAPAADPLTGQIAAYARGDDYHDLIKKRLFVLWDAIQTWTEGKAQGRVYVDTAPVLERELAQRAGLGWWGKNTCLIAKERGSYFFLAEIILDQKLAYDQPAVDHCGTCTRCIEACPTQAFPEPYVLDARRCISYLTIELKEAIPPALRSQMGNWIFGCDDCQTVCPWNTKTRPTDEAAFAPRPGLEAPDLIELLGLDPEAFSRRFRRNPAKRPKRRGLLRNVCVALGNSGRPEAVPPLIDALKDEEPLVRGHAAWALGRLGGSKACRGLQQALGKEADDQVRDEIQQALESIRAQEV